MYKEINLDYKNASRKIKIAYQSASRAGELLMKVPQELGNCLWKIIKNLINCHKRTSRVGELVINLYPKKETFFESIIIDGELLIKFTKKERIAYENASRAG